MNAQEVRTLIDYNYWARDRMFDAVSTLTPEQMKKDMGSSFRSIHDTLIHIYGAEWIWLTRWIGESPTVLPSSESIPNLDALRKTWTEFEGQFRAYFSRLDDIGLQESPPYKMMNGAPAPTTKLWEMLQHVVNHGSYHRGQITTMLRQLQAAPAKSVDLITFYRERDA